MKKIVLVVAAHPDDELLGAGGTLAKHAADGDEVYGLILGEGVMARSGANRNGISYLQKQAQTAAKIIGLKKIQFADFPDNAFDSVPLLKIVQKVEAVIAAVCPDIVFTHYEHDLNIDHRLPFQAVLTACRPMNPHCPRELYTFETLSSTEWQSKGHQLFAPDTYVDIAPTLEIKLKALQAYASELRPYPHSRSLEGVKILAEWRGLESHLAAAEAFRTIRRIVV